MKRVGDMTNKELRIALATEGEGSWTNVRSDSRGNLFADVPGALSEFPTAIPDWPGDIAEAMKLESGIDALGMSGDYIRHLSLITQADGTPEGLFRLAHATARQRSEAALATLRA